MDKVFVVLLAALSLPALAQQRPDPRIEQAVSQTLIVAMERSVSPAKTIPQPVERVRPAVNEPGLQQVDDALYIDRRLLPPRATQPDDPGAVRIFRKDAR
jgi:hypothetical protein